METNVAKIVQYVDTDGLHRWRAMAANNEIVAQGEAHTRPEDAERAASAVFPGVPIEHEVKE